MAYDENLAARLRRASGDEFIEKMMFGGLAFMRDGHMCFGIVDRDAHGLHRKAAQGDGVRRP